MAKAANKYKQNQNSKDPIKPLPIHIYLGGSFDPVHNSHIALISHVYQQLATDDNSVQAYFMPTSRSPLKSDSSEAEHRLQMLSAAIADLKGPNSSSPSNFQSNYSTEKINLGDLQSEDKLTISEHEIWQTPPTYSIDTLSELRQQYPDTSLVFIIGADNVASLPRWKQGNKLTEFAHLWVIPREQLQSQAEITALLPQSIQSQVTSSIADLKNETYGHIYIDSHTVAPLSSSAIRKAIIEGELDIAQAALPPSVYSYIIKNDLYHRY